jgi:hypothetical protein
MPENWIQDAYADANKPFSELWNEEGIVWITNTPGDRRLGSQRYVLNPEDHDKFFTLSIQKANRRSLSPIEKEDIRKKRILGVIFASHKSIHVYRLKSIHSVEIEFGRYSTTVYLSKKEGLVKRKTFKPSVFTVTNQNGKSVQFVQQKRATNALLPTQNEIK